MSRFLQILSLSFLLLDLSFFSLRPGWAGERLHLSELKKELAGNDKISLAFKERPAADKPASKSELKKQDQKLKALFKKHKKVREKYLAEFRASTPFVRGEIEDIETLNSLMALLQLSILEMRVEFEKGNWQRAQNEAQAWFNFAADLAYEESTNVGLKTAAVIRTFLLDEFETMVKQKGQEIAKTSQFREWLQRIRAPWPIDRVIVSESKRALPPALLPTADKVAKSLQQSPYQTAAEALEKIPGAKPRDLDYLKELWKNDDIGRMKEEITRIGKLKLKMAALEYEYQHKKPALVAEDLVKSKLLDRIPIDYTTGKPMELGGL